LSSTNRSNARKKHISDYYVTPINKILDFLHGFNKYEDIFVKQGRDKNGKPYPLILDPCAGGDANHPMSYPVALQQIGINPDNIITIDIRQDSRADIKEDYLEIDCPGDFDVIITNPPFNLAREIIEKALNDVNDGGFVIMLLRLNFFGGKLRKDMWDRQMPKYAFVHNRRMSFTDDGKTDSIEYMHAVWQKGHYPEFTQLKVI
jgi:hypothetical protein